MANPTSLKVLNSNGVEEVLQVGDKVKYRIHYDYRSSRAVDTVVRFTKTRAYLQNGGYITEDGLAQGSKQNRSYIGKYGQLDQLNDRLQNCQKMLVKDAEDLKVQTRHGDIREPQDNPKAYIDGLRDIQNLVNKMMEWAQELDEIQTKTNKK